MHRVEKHLTDIGIETPRSDVIQKRSHEEKLFIINNNIYEIMLVLGLDLGDDSLQDTPKRVAKMFLNELFKGLDYENFPKMTVIENKMQLDQMVCVKGIDISSTCEHHWVAIDGLAKIAYIPADKILGLSKFNRIVEFFASRPQVQERLTQQIKETLCFLLEIEDVAVQIDAKHFCVKSRGVKDTGSTTVTCALGGKFLTIPSVRKEFFDL